jgi:hypothetical protein
MLEDGGTIQPPKRCFKHKKLTMLLSKKQKSKKLPLSYFGHCFLSAPLSQSRSSKFVQPGFRADLSLWCQIKSSWMLYYLQRMMFHWQLMAPCAWLLRVETRWNETETVHMKWRRRMTEKQWRPEIASTRSSEFMNSFLFSFLVCIKEK